MEQFITSFIASAAFGIIFNAPKKAIIQCGFVGMFGWILYLSLYNMNEDTVIATLISAFFIAVLSQTFAKLYKTPIIIFNVSGIIPLVPGGLAYDAMRKFVENDYDIAVQLAAKAFMISGAIAIGLVFSEVVNQLIRKSRLGGKKNHF
ncbi:threonine/serine exporter family protein [Metabacillus fastidiosus]|uniref:Threonine/serine exporter family protein n=1 Tax=Metabacillus fastidiosus TaxID=1458 RepID=A0ABU6P273_9BACI|nr:threonine/serine exporter family protein [Metabacillus fastidiosus]MED4403461.1 threonine/serine exporter family protein [Metabacillus fastidiosus]MED4454057.1 threonine/serine exporter family protein [Metabacillus fastidiosus]MED4460815.1 threonine/serine exporter family protein [Metabacillus fastidiosus]